MAEKASSDVPAFCAVLPYESGPDIEACLMNGTAAEVGFIYNREERVFSLGYEAAEITDEIRASSRLEDIQKCLHAGVPRKRAPLGTLKHTDGARHFLCRGNEKVTVEFALSCLSYNICRAITLCGGVSKLIERFKGITMPKTQKIG